MTVSRTGQLSYNRGVRQLYDLQELDWKIAGAEKSLAEVRAHLADDSAITSIKERHQQLQARLQETEQARRAAERTVSEIQDSLALIESRLFGGAITSARELTAAQEERDFKLGQLREEEDKLLEQMVEVEDVQSSHRDAAESLSKLEAERPGLEAEMRGSEESLTRELGEFGRSRDGIVPTIPSDALSRYESLLKRKNGQAVAKVERGTCQGCRLALTTMELQRARNARGLVHCSSCQRILYVV